MFRYFFILFIFPFNILKANDIDFKIIPEDLKQDANLIVRYYEQEYILDSDNKATYKVKYAFTILNKKADKYANCIIYYDKFNFIYGVKGTVYNKNGEIVEKFYGPELTDQSITAGANLYDDNRVKYYEIHQKDYPYTIEIQYTKTYRGYAHIPRWQPVWDYNIAIENARYSLKKHTSIEINKKELNYFNEIEGGSHKNYETYTWEVENFKALKDEPYSPFLWEYTPTVLFAPNKFIYDGHPGSQATWNDIGSWIWNLNLGRDVLTPETNYKIKELINGIEDPIEKVKVLYEFMQSKTRYVSIQLGIGGYQPISALEVDQLGYGDCKALSNYMIALLKQARIDAYYSVIRAGRNSKEIFSDFSSIGQMNHVIVCVPFEKDTLWLECTDQEQPFGFLGSFTDDRYALLVKPNSGELVKTKKYSQDENSQTRTVKVSLNEDLSINALINTKYRAVQYDNVSYQFRESPKEQRENLYDDLNLVNFDINEFAYKQKKDIIPSAYEFINLNVNNYAKPSGKRLFLPLNILNKQTHVPKKIANRNSDILLNFAYSDYDTIVYKIPEKYKVEFLPDSSHIKSPFGEYWSYTTINDNNLTYVRINKRNEGRFPKEKYPDLIGFYKSIKKADKQKAILIEKE